jgi:2-dehydropantoate 2-reductase
MRFVVVGTGAIGGVVGGKLAAAGHDVVLVARGAQFAAIRERGLRIETPAGPMTVTAPVVDRVDAVDWRDDDVALVATKTQDVAGALAPIGVDVTVACLTNGIEAERIALRRFSRVLAVSVVCPASFTVPGVVQLWSEPVAGTLDLGAYPSGSSAQASAVAAVFETAGFASLVRDDIMRWKRGKLLSNLGNAAEALTGPAARTSAIAKQARAEGLACYAAAGLSTISDDEDAARRSVWKLQPIAGRTRSGGSTWQSLARGTGAVEADYLNGEIVLLGRAHGVPTPVNAALQRLVANAARAGSPPGSMTLDELDQRIG